mgnify:CR=1 FL=1
MSVSSISDMKQLNASTLISIGKHTPSLNFTNAEGVNKRVMKDTITTESAQDIGVTNVMSRADTHTRRHATPPRSSMAMARDCQKITNLKNNKHGI